MAPWAETAAQLQRTAGRIVGGPHVVAGIAPHR